MALWDEQADALVHALAADGLFAALAVGRGKTLIAQLLPTVLDKRAVILTTPGLVRQGERMLEEYRRSFWIRDDLQYLAYSTLSRAEHADALEELAPELIIADECHSLKDASAARTKRFLRYMKAHPNTLFCGLSGTITKRSILDFAHLLRLALGDYTPLPRDWPTLKEWAECLDVGGMRPAGALLGLAPVAMHELFPSWQETKQERARRIWKDKFRSTRGVVASDENKIGSTLIIRKAPLETPPEIQEHLDVLFDRWVRPDGEELEWAMDLAKTARQLRLGGHYFFRWDSNVSERDRIEWTECRREWRRDVRALLKLNRPGMDSPKLVADACERGDAHVQSYRPWMAVRARVPRPVPEWSWLSFKPLEAVLGRVADHWPCVVWTDCVPFGRRLAGRLGARWYGAGCKDLVESGEKTIVCSIQAHGTGRNLQMFSRAVVAGGTPTGVTWEQLLGRLHRSGQEADEVVFEVLFPGELEGAIEDAQYTFQTTGLRQKLLSATIL